MGLTPPEAIKRGRCKSCGAPLFWVRTPNGKSMPVDAESRKPIETNGAVVVLAGKTGMHAVTGQVALYTSHFATCPNAAEHRKKS